LTKRGFALLPIYPACGRQIKGGSMKLKNAVSIAALMVLSICVYTFLLGNKFFEGQFENDGFAWYFLAKGLFCSIALYLLALILEKLTEKK
jgi:hypothetical protein